MESKRGITSETHFFPVFGLCSSVFSSFSPSLYSTRNQKQQSRPKRGPGVRCSESRAQAPTAARAWTAPTPQKQPTEQPSLQPRTSQKQEEHPFALFLVLSRVNTFFWPNAPKRRTHISKLSRGTRLHQTRTQAPTAARAWASRTITYFKNMKKYDAESSAKLQ